MGENGAIDPVELASAIVEKSLDSEPVRNLLGPVTTNVGNIFGLISDIGRFYTEENLAAIFTKWAKQRKGKPLDPESFKRALPLLRDAAMQSEEELQDRWASLLENTVNGSDGVLPSFGQTLSQLTPDEARYLDKIWEFVTQPRNYLSSKRDGREELGHHSLVEIYAPHLQHAPDPAEMRVHKNRMSPEQLASYDMMTNFELILHDLERLSLIERKVAYIPGRMTYAEVGSTEIETGLSEGGMVTKYALTQYGVNFIWAVRPTKSES